MRCRWGAFTEAEFDEVIRCTARWKARGGDSVHQFPIKKCPSIGKAVFEKAKKMVEWKMTTGVMMTTVGSCQEELSSSLRAGTSRILLTTDP